MSLLDERLIEIDQRLSKALQNARSSTRHRGIRGGELASALGRELQDHLVDCASYHASCEVQDSHGTLSREVDLVLLNRHHPRFLVENRPPAFYVEGVIAAAEVKTSLDKKETIDCLEKARAFKRLLAKVEGKDLQAHNIDSADWFRFLLRRPFFAFAFEDRRDLWSLQGNIEEWVRTHRVPESEQIDAVFVLNRGVVLNLGRGSGAIEMRDSKGELLRGFVRKSIQSVAPQLVPWLSLVCPSFGPPDPILLKYAKFETTGYTK